MDVSRTSANRFMDLQTPVGDSVPMNLLLLATRSAYAIVVIRNPCRPICLSSASSARVWCAVGNLIGASWSNQGWPAMRHHQCHHNYLFWCLARLSCASWLIILS